MWSYPHWNLWQADKDTDEIYAQMSLQPVNSVSSSTLTFVGKSYQFPSHLTLKEKDPFLIYISAFD